MNNWEILKSELEKVLAIEMLQYHDKNYLSMSDEKLNEEKQVLLRLAIDRIKFIRTGHH